MRVYLSSPLQLFFYELRSYTSEKNPLSHYLYEASFNSNFSFMQVHEGDLVSVIAEKKINDHYSIRVKEKGYIDFDYWLRELYADGDSIAWTKSRINIKLGRLIKKILTDNEKSWTEYRNYYHSTKSDDELIEEAVNYYKELTKRANDPNFENRFELAEGEDIRKWYYEGNNIVGKGSLNESCMRYEKCSKYLDIYVNNPKICKLLVFKEADDKISIRALIWNLPDGRVFMDRIYSSRYSDMIIFMNYAKKKGWLCRDLNNNIEENLSIQLQQIDYDYFPYMDTFKYFDNGTGRISKLKPDNIRTWLLEKQDGGYY